MLTDFKYLIIQKENLIKERCYLALRFLASNQEEFYILLTEEQQGYIPKALYHQNHQYILEATAKDELETHTFIVSEKEVKHFAKYQRYANKIYCPIYSKKQVDNLLKDRSIGTFLITKDPQESGCYYLCFVNKESKSTFIAFTPAEPHSQKDYILIDTASGFIKDANDNTLKYRHLYDLIVEQINAAPRFLNTSKNHHEAKTREQPRIIRRYKGHEEISKSAYLEQDEYGDTQPNADCPIIGTSNFSACLAILIYSKDKSCVIHAFPHSSEKKTDGLQAVLIEVFGEAIFDRPSSLLVTIAGGIDLVSSSVFAEKIKTFFQSRSISFNTELLYGDVRTIAIDARNGHIICGGIIKDNITSATDNKDYHKNDRFAYFKIELSKKKNVPLESIFIKTISNGEISYGMWMSTHSKAPLPSSTFKH